MRRKIVRFPCCARDGWLILSQHEFERELSLAVDDMFRQGKIKSSYMAPTYCEIGSDSMPSHGTSGGTLNAFDVYSCSKKMIMFSGYF